MENKTPVTVEVTVKAPVKKVWKYWKEPAHIMMWCYASDDWHTPRSENDLRVGGRFLSRMEAKDGSAGFDFGGEYDEVEENKRIAYTIDDGRKVSVSFSGDDKETRVTETFDPEDVNSLEMQKNGWQAILDNLKKYTENH